MVKPAKGTPTLAFIFKDGAMVAADSRASMGGYISSQSVKKIIQINPYMLGTMAGVAVDCQFWHRNMGIKDVELLLLQNSQVMQGFYEYAKSKGIDVGKAVGIKVVLDGIVPTGITIMATLGATFTRKNLLNFLVNVKDTLALNSMEWTSIH